MLTKEQSHFICRSLGIPVKGFKVKPLRKEASVRNYFRVSRQVQSQNKGLKQNQDTKPNKSWVFMRWEPFKEKDFPFIEIQKFLQKNAIPVPEILAFNVKEGLFLLEDLGDTTLEEFSQRHSPEDLEPWYKKAIDHLIKIQFTEEYPPKAITHINPCFNTEFLFKEMKTSLENLKISEEKTFLNEEREKRICELFFSICGCLDREKKRICHRDYHSRNLMIHNEKMYVLDFQDARLGCIQYDLISLLEDVYIDLDEEIKQKLLRYYWDRYSERDPQNKSFESFWEGCQLQLLQRLFKVCATFSGFYLFRKDDRYTRYISTASKRIIKTLENFPHYEPLKEMAQRFHRRYTPQ